MEDVLHQVIDRVQWQTEDQLRRAHDTVSAWFRGQSSMHTAPTTVDQPPEVVTARDK